MNRSLAHARKGLFFSLALLVAACNLAVPPGGITKASASAKPKASAKPTLTGTGDPTGDPTGVPTANPGGKPLDLVAKNLLLKPAEGTSLLSGEVSIEASFAFTQGGRLISDAGSGLVSDQGGGLIGDAGSGLIGKVKAPSLIGDAGSGLIGKAKSPSLIGDAGSGLIGDAGSGMISNNGGSAIAVGGARVEGGQLVGAGGQLISNNSGNIVASTAGGRAVALVDGTLIAGAGILANNAAGAVSNAGALFRLAQAGGTPLPVAGTPSPAGGTSAPTTGDPPSAVGVRLPAGGMLVSVVSLSTWEYLPIGRDGAGKPVFAVYSDSFGRFDLHVPADQKDNVLIVATVPGSRDARATYELVTADRSQALAVDDLGRLVARYIRRAFSGRIASTLKDPALSRFVLEPQDSFAGETSMPNTPKGQVAAFIDLMGELAKEAGIDETTPQATLNRKGLRLVDMALARVDLKNLKITADDIGIWRTEAGPKPPTPVLEAFRKTITILLDGSTKKLRKEPGFFTQSYLVDVINATNAPVRPTIGDWTGKITTPQDVGEFMLVEYFGAIRSNGIPPLQRLFKVFHEARGDANPQDASWETTDLILSAGNETSIAIARVLLREDLRAEIRAILAEPDPTP